MELSELPPPVITNEMLRALPVLPLDGTDDESDNELEAAVPKDSALRFTGNPSLAQVITDHLLLIDLCEGGCAAGVAKLIHDKRLHVSVQLDSGRFPLGVATRLGHVDVVRVLLEQLSVHINLRPVNLMEYGLYHWNRTPAALYQAIALGHHDVARLLIQHSDLDLEAVVFANGDSALVAAIQFGPVDLVRQLIGANANIDRFGAGGMSPLARAVARPVAMWSVIVQLLQFGADVDGRASKDAETALMVAAGGSSGRVVALLLMYGADPHITYDDISGREPSAVDVARNREANRGRFMNHAPLSGPMALRPVAVLLVATTDEMPWYRSTLKLACMFCLLEYLYAFIRAGADVNLEAEVRVGAMNWPNGRMPLQVWVHSGNEMLHVMRAFDWYAQHATQVAPGWILRHAATQQRSAVAAVRAVVGGWRPYIHWQQYGVAFRRGVQLFLLVFQRLTADGDRLPYLPDELRLHIFGFIRRQWFV